MISKIIAPTFVKKLIELSAEVRAIIGSHVQISYAANWSEYHSHDGYRALDDLWSNKNINFVGIDFYMPLTDTTGADISLDEIKKGFSSGEGFDYYYDNNIKIAITEPNNRWKDIETWHHNEHWGWDHDTQTSCKTKWKPCSKPIIFSEFGFSSIDKATNQPNVYGDILPKHSNGKIDNALQLRALRATIEYIKESGFIRDGFCYGWDSRGLNWQKRFKDGSNWARGYWLDGKI